MAEVSLARQQAYSALHHGGSPDGHFSRDLSAPAAEPNPPFVFPARDDRFGGLTTRPFSSHTTTRRPETIISQFPNRRSAGALPDFVFHPSPSHSSNVETGDAPEAPTNAVPIPSRTGGHRRSGSEFIGVNGPSGLLSASPTGGLGSLSLPNPTARPTAGRRGHAHRRSGAISCHDLASLVMKPADVDTNNRAGSAPTTPSGHETGKSFETPESFSLQQGQLPDATPPGQSSSPNIGAQPPRTRVGFSETLEYIPRPPSTVSSETSSTMSAKLGHVISGSSSSPVIGTAGSPRPRAARSSPQAPAGDVSMSHSNVRAASGGGFAPSSQGSPTSSPRLGRPATPGFLLNDVQGKSGSTHAFSTATGPVPVLLPSPPQSPIPSPSLEVDSEYIDETMSGADRKMPRKEKRVKSWAGSILPRKSRHRDQQPLPSGERVETPSLLDWDSSDPPTGVISEPVSIDDFSFSSWKPREISSNEAEALSPVIDLDAALGPFQSPGDDLGPEFRKPLNGGFQVAKRRMHSSGKTGGFTGPGMHYHRRAESAPEMVAFDFNRSELEHTGSTMEDVFEEDEENEEEDESSGKVHRVSATTAEEESDQQGLGIDIEMDTTPDVASNPAVSSHEPNQTDTSTNKLLEVTERVDLGVSPKSSPALVSDEAAFGEVGMLETLDQSESAGSSPFRDVTSRCGTTAPVESGILKENSRSVSMPERFALPIPSAPFLAPETPSSISSFSRQSFDQQSVTFDVSRYGTAASSVAESTTLSSLYFGEPGPEFFSSVDDVPSLTNSDSTMASALHQAHIPGSAHSGGYGERSASISSTKTGRQSRYSLGRKRSSLASLSKLVSRSSFERSKLSIETREHSDNAEISKSGKPRRFSRMMSFWKPKEASTS